MAAITLEELLEEVGVCPEKLNDSIGDDHLREISLFLTSWRTVASHLDLSENDLDDAEQGGRKVKDKIQKALQIWKGKFGFKATYRKLVQVLLSLGMADVAENVCRLLKESISVHVSVTSVLQLHSNSREHEASDAKSANDVNTGLTDVLSKQPEFQQLSTSEQEELMVTLYDDEKSMRRQFGKLVVKTCDSVEERVPVVKFARSILALGAYDPAPGDRDPALLDEHSEEIKRAGSISEIFNILSTYWNYLNYEILEDIIELYGTSDDAERLRNYNKELYKFCKRRIFELPPESSNGNTLSPNQERFRVKLNFRKDITYQQLLQIRGRIAKILKIRLAVLLLSRVDEGCVQLTFLIPKYVAQEIFPLSCEQTSALSKGVSLIRLECGQYTFENTGEMHTEDAVAHNTVFEGLEDESQLQKEPGAERQVEAAKTNRNSVCEAVSGPTQLPSRAAPQQLASSSRSMLSATGIQMQYYPSTYGKPPRRTMSYYTTLAADPMPSSPFLPTPSIPSPLSLYQRPTQFFPVHCQQQQTLALKGAQPVNAAAALMMPSEQSVVHVHNDASPTECKAVKHESLIMPPSYTTLTTKEADSSTASCVNDQGYISHDSISLQHGEGQEYYVQTPVTSVQVPPFPSFSHSQLKLCPPYSHGISTYAHPRAIPYPSHSAHKEEPFPRHYSCEICGKSYARESTLKTHLRIHTSEKPYQCSICQKSFTQAANLTAHLRTHSGEKPFKCPICNRGFSQSSSVVTHLRTHCGDRLYKCNACGKGFANSSTLTKHYRTHRGNLPRSEPMPSPSFLPTPPILSTVPNTLSMPPQSTVPNTLSMPLQSTAPNSGEKPFKCPICNQGFSQCSSVATHLRTDCGGRPYKCNACGKRFANSSTLTKHYRTHRGNLPRSEPMPSPSFLPTPPILSTVPNTLPMPPQSTVPNTLSMPPQSTAPNTWSMPPQSTAPNTWSMPSQSTAPNTWSMPLQSTAPNTWSMPSQSTAPNTWSMPLQSTAPNTWSMPLQSTAPNTLSMPLQSTAPNTLSMPLQSTAPNTLSMPLQSTAPNTLSMPLQSTAPNTLSMPLQSTAPNTLSMPLQSTAPNTLSMPLHSTVPNTLEWRDMGRQTWEDRHLQQGDVRTVY